MAGSVGDGGCEVNLTPLLDLVLQLIMFFMITVNFVRVDQFDDSIKLPMSSQATPLDNDAHEYIFLNLNPKGELVGNLSNFSLDTPEKLKAHLMNRRKYIEAEKGVASGSQKIVVVLRADQNVRYSRVWEVLDSCKRGGFAHWQLRVMTGGKQ